VGQKRKILILGGGFGGVKTALELCRDERFEITLVSEHRDFRYYPTLYRAATGGKLPASSIPLSEIFSNSDLKFVEAGAKSLDRSKKIVTTDTDKQFKYDDLVVALGSVTNYFDIKGLRQNAYGIKSVDEAQRLRDHLHKTLLDDGKPDVNYVVIGGGPTGVELAGALPGYLSSILKRHKLSKKSLHIDLVEASPRLLPSMPRGYSRRVARRLRKLGVKLYLGQSVQAETADSLMVSGHSIASHTVVWTAGVAVNPFIAANEFGQVEHGKVAVDDHLQAEDHVYVIGDNAATPFSGMAQTALYDASFVATNLKRAASGKNLKSYKPHKPIYVIPVGPHWAAVKIWGFCLYGTLGWLLRSAANLIGYHDLEPWRKAGKHWLAEAGEQEDCPICAASLG